MMMMLGSAAAPCGLVRGISKAAQMVVSPASCFAPLARPGVPSACMRPVSAQSKAVTAPRRCLRTLATPDGAAQDNGEPSSTAPAAVGATATDASAAAAAADAATTSSTSIATTTSSTSIATTTSSTSIATTSSSASTSGGGGVPLLTAAEPIDRLRYQALLIFAHFDGASAGRLSAEQVQQFFTWSSRKVSWSPGLCEVLQQVEAKFAPLKAAGCSKEEFIKLVRAQVHAVSTSQAFTSTMNRPDVTARLQAQMSLTLQELAAAKWMFGLLDFDNDGKVALSMYATAQGIEAYVYEDKIEDADADDDGFIVFEEFLVSYAKPKPIFKNMLIMVINTAVIYLILSAPMLDVMLKVVLVGVLLLRPQLVSKPAGLLHDTVKAIIDQGRAQAELAKSNRGVWRPA